MSTTIEELDELWNKYDEKSMRAMGGGRPEEFFGAVRASVKHFSAQQKRSQYDSKIVIEKAWKLLDRAVGYFVGSGESITDFAVELFEDIKAMLLQLIQQDFRINHDVYEQASATDLKIRAAEECGIKLPGRICSRGGLWSRNESADLNAMSYVQDNIRDFAIFLWNAAETRQPVSNPIRDPGSAEYFDLYKKVSSLVPRNDLFSQWISLTRCCS